MPKLYKQLPAEDERFPAWARFWVPEGPDSTLLKAQEKGWRIDIPSGCDVYNEDGILIQQAPQKPSPAGSSEKAEKEK